MKLKSRYVELPLTNSARKLKVSVEDLPRLKGKKLFEYGQDRYVAFREVKVGELDGAYVLWHCHIPVHRYLLKAQNGQYVDHKDLDIYNCARDNIRLCTKSQNHMNRGVNKNNTSGYKGVLCMARSGNYRAVCKKDRKDYFGGTYASAEIAARMYDKLAVKLHGEFARLNFEEDRKTAASYLPPKYSDLSRSPSKSGYTGVYKAPCGTFYCQGYVNGKLVNLKRKMKTALEAHRYRCKTLGLACDVKAQ